MLDFSVTFVITIVNIVILFFILKKILLKPVTKFTADRTKRIQDSLMQAETEKVEARKMLAQYKEKLKNAEDEAEEIIRAAHKNAKADAEKIIARGKVDADVLITSARKQIETEQKAALARFNVEATALVIAASARLVQREFSGDDNRRYVNMLLDELTAQKRN
jgi:F-type H+-transporting ATPase subunit b